MEQVSEDAPLAVDCRSDSQEVLLEPSTAAPARLSSSNAHALKVAGITTLVCLLVSAQAFTAYMVFNQRQQIQELQASNARLQWRMTQRPRAADSVVMPSGNLPLLDVFGDYENFVNPTKAEPKASSLTPESKVEQDEAYQSLEEELQNFMDVELPRFNQTFLANLQALKEQINEASWTSLESWLRHWLLFQSVQKAPTPRPASMTKCQVEASNGVQLGSFRPQCDEQGNYETMQCWSSTGHCWCVDQNGATIEGSHTRGRPDCDKVLRPSPTSGDALTTSDYYDDIEE